MSEFTPAQIAAIAGVLPSKQISQAKAGLLAGQQACVELQLALKATVKKSEPTLARPTASLLSKASVAWLLRRLGATRATTQKVMAELAEHALESGGKVGDQMVAQDDRILAAMAEVEHDLLAKLPKQERAGRVTVVGEITPVDDAPGSDAPGSNAPGSDHPSHIAAEAAPSATSGGELEMIAAEGDIEITAAGTSGAGEGTTSGAAPAPRFDMTAYTGGPMRLKGWRYPVYADLEGMDIRAQRRPVRFQHDANRGVGHTEQIRVEGAGDQAHLIASGFISRQTPEAHEVINAAKSGFPWQASIGANADQVEFIKPGRSGRVNGRTVAGPAYIARKSSLGEISFVDLGADTNTTANIAAKHDPPAHPNGDDTMTFEQWLQAKGFTAADLTDTQKASLQAAYNAEHAPPEDDPNDTPGDRPRRVQASGGASGGTSGGDLDSVLADGRREATRRQAITGATQRILAERPELSDSIGRLAQGAIEANWDAQRYELELLRLGRSAGGGASGTSGGGFVRRDRARDGRVLEAALCLSGGLEKPEKHFPEQTLEAAEGQFGRGLGLGELLLMHAQSNGYRGHGTSNLRSLLQCAFSDTSGGEMQASGFSTYSLPGILSNTANKFLRQGFEAVESTWRSIAATRSVRDFKQITSYSLVGGFEYEKVPASGELKHGSVDEVKYTNKAETYGKMFAITRQDIINDDLGALTQVPRRLGRGAALKLNDVFWATFLANAGFFKAANNNLAEGANTALGLDALTAAEQLFFDQVDHAGNPMATMPMVLLAPNGLSTPAAQLMNSTEIRPGSSGKTPISNPHAGKFTPVRSSYLSNSKYPGASTKAWYLLADPQDVPVIEVAFLNGRDTPMVESADADFNTLGVQMRGYHDFGVALQEFRGGVKMTGEAA